MNHHTLAIISLTGVTLDVLGGLYLAYDLLGGQHGPLRLITRMVTYCILFCAFYSLGMGITFGLAAGLTTGITIAIELNRVAIGKPHYSMFWEAIFSIVRGIGFAVGLYHRNGELFAVAFAVLSVVGQIWAYSQGMRPSIDYHPGTRPRITRRQWWGTVNRTFGFLLAALLCAFVTHRTQGALPYATRLGLTSGFATGIGIMTVPVVEYYADHLPERRMGVFGIVLILCGFALQSLQYWFSLLDVPIH